MQKISLHLDNRLSLCAEFVRKNSRLADVGTDHAYLPVWLCKNRIICSAVAVDINKAPLERGQQTIIKYNMEKLIDTRISNGLSNIKENEVDDIVIAGMGGELIAEIINNTKWLKKEKYHLILQPMTKAEFLRNYLYENGFEIKEEKATITENKIYSVMSVYYTENFEIKSEIEKYYGQINPKNSQYDYEYIVKVANSLRKKGNGILSSDPYNYEAKKYINYSKILLRYSEKGEKPQLITVNDIYNFIDTFAPFDKALDFDNVGILVGDKNVVINKALVALDITEDVIYEAQRINADLIISHHPVIFKPVKSISSKSIPYMIAQRGLTVICAHTNLDISKEGVNICLANVLGLKNITLHNETIAIGTLVNETTSDNLSNEKYFTSKQFAKYVKEKLNCNGVRYTDIKNKIKTVAVGGGACGEYIHLAKELGADAFVTGEIKHNYILESHSINLTVVDAGHYKTEDVVIDFLVEKLNKQFKNIEFIKSQVFTDYIDYV